jgi:hypothetical protein
MVSLGFHILVLSLVNQAPEVIKSQAYNTKADVFSYAIVMGELVIMLYFIYYY